jgi:methionyl-tRNA formyltransferase
MRMDEGMDTGPILLQVQEPIGDDDNSGSLGSRLAEIGGGLLVQTLDRLEAGELTEQPQDHAGATYAPKLQPPDRIIDWGESHEAVVRRIRALAPDPGAVTTFRGRGLKILRAHEVSNAAPPAGGPGSLTGGKDRIVVGTGGTPLELDEVQPEGRRRMAGAEFVRGYRPEPGERLG